MNLDSLNKWLMFAANLGVIAGILFLAVEIRQNNEYLAFERSEAELNHNMDSWVIISQEPYLVELLVKDRNGEVLTLAEEITLNSWWMRNMLNWEWTYQLDPEQINWGSISRIFDTYETAKRTWKGNPDGSVGSGPDNFAPEFVRELEKHISINN